MPESNNQPARSNKPREIMLQRGGDGTITEAGSSTAKAGGFNLADYAASRRRAIAAGDLAGGMGASLSTIGGSNADLNLTLRDADPSLPSTRDLARPPIEIDPRLPTTEPSPARTYQRGDDVNQNNLLENFEESVGACSSCQGKREWNPSYGVLAIAEGSVDYDLSVDEEGQDRKSHILSFRLEEANLLRTHNSLKDFANEEWHQADGSPVPTPDHDPALPHLDDLPELLEPDPEDERKARGLDHYPTPPSDWLKNWEKINKDKPFSERSVLVYNSETGFWETWTITEVLRALRQTISPFMDLLAIYSAKQRKYVVMSEFLCGLIKECVSNRSENKSPCNLSALWSALSARERARCLGSLDADGQSYLEDELYMEGIYTSSVPRQAPNPKLPYKRVFNSRTRARRRFRSMNSFLPDTLIPLLWKECEDDGVEIREIHARVYLCGLPNGSKGSVESALAEAKMLFIQCCIDLTWEFIEGYECDLKKAYGGIPDPSGNGVVALGVFPPSDAVQTWGKDPSHRIMWKDKNQAGVGELGGRRSAVVHGDKPGSSSSISVSGTVIAHEIGHNAGLDHPGHVPGQVMDGGAESVAKQERGTIRPEPDVEFTADDCMRLRLMARTKQPEFSND